jgi:hypothetical protein
MSDQWRKMVCWGDLNYELRIYEEFEGERKKNLMILNLTFMQCQRRETIPLKIAPKCTHSWVSVRYYLEQGENA